MAKKTTKYNSAEVHITHSVVGLFLFALIALSVWGIRKLHLMTGWAIFVSVGLLVALTVVVGILKRRQRKAGVPFENTVWSMDFWFYICCAALISHGILLLSLPVDWWLYTTPIAWLWLGEMYLLYVTTQNQDAQFRYCGWLCAVSGIGAYLNFQTYYNKMQNFVSFRFVQQDLAFTIGWIGLMVLAVAIWYFGKKKGYGIWKFESVVAIFALYWLVLQQGWIHGGIASVICGAMIALYFVVLRILRQIKVI